VIAASLIWPITDVIAAHDVGRIAGLHRATQLQAAREATRTQLLTLAAGVFVAWTLWFTAQNFRLSRQGQVTDRYTKAIEQLGSKELDVRIGGIYALERIAHDSVRDHPTVMEVLAAFIREHSREQWPRPASDAPGAEAYPRATRPDIQAALTVIGRRDSRRDREAINLTGAHLPYAHLREADLSDVGFGHANLFRARLVGANLAHAELNDALLSEAILIRTNLTDADLWEANLSRTHLAGAILTGARFYGADLRGADFRGAYVTTHSITVTAVDADLTVADFTDADLTDAILAEDQPVPEGWLRDPDSRRLRRSSPAADDS
jgi:hypothetical protein